MMGIIAIFIPKQQKVYFQFYPLFSQLMIISLVVGFYPIHHLSCHVVDFIFFILLPLGSVNHNFLSKSTVTVAIMGLENVSPVISLFGNQ